MEAFFYDDVLRQSLWYMERTVHKPEQYGNNTHFIAMDARLYMELRNRSPILGLVPGILGFPPSAAPSASFFSFLFERGFLFSLFFIFFKY